MIIRVIGFNEGSFENTSREFTVDETQNSLITMSVEFEDFIVNLLKGAFTDFIRIQKVKK